MLFLHIPLAVCGVLLAVLLAGPVMGQRSWLNSMTLPCIHNCGRAGNCGQGVHTELSRLKECNRYMQWEPNWRYGTGPGACKSPDWIGDAKFARDYYWTQVCAQERNCVKSMLSRKPNNEFEELQRRVMDQRRHGIAFRDEIHYSQYPDYIRSVNELTSLKDQNEVLSFIAAGGKVPKSNTLFNPVFQKTAHYLQETAKFKKRAHKDRFIRERKVRDIARGKFVRAVEGNLADLLKQRSKLKGLRPSDVRDVKKWLANIHKYTKYIKAVQEEAIQVQFYKRAEKSASVALKKHQSDVMILRQRLRDRVETRRALQLRLAGDKVNLVDALHSLTNQLAAEQKKRCK